MDIPEEEREEQQEEVMSTGKLSQKKTQKLFQKMVDQKSTSQNFLNVAIIQSQLSVLIETFKKENYSGEDKALISLILINLVIQGFIFSMILFVGNLSVKKTKNKNKIRVINSAVTFISGVVLIINIVITILMSG